MLQSRTAAWYELADDVLLQGASMYTIIVGLCTARCYSWYLVYAMAVSAEVDDSNTK